MKIPARSIVTLAALTTAVAILTSCGKDVERTTGTLAQTTVPGVTPVTPVTPTPVNPTNPANPTTPTPSNPGTAPAPTPGSTILTLDQVVDGNNGCYSLISLEQAVVNASGQVLMTASSDIDYYVYGRRRHRHLGIDDSTSLDYVAPGASRSIFREGARVPVKFEREDGDVFQDVYACPLYKRVNIVGAGYDTFGEFVTQGGWTEIRLSRLSGGDVEVFVARPALHDTSAKQVIRAVYQP